MNKSNNFLCAIILQKVYTCDELQTIEKEWCVRTKLYDTHSALITVQPLIFYLKSDGFTIIDVALKRYQTCIVLDITVCRDIILWIKEVENRKRKRYI